LSIKEKPLQDVSTHEYHGRSRTNTPKAPPDERDRRIHFIFVSLDLISLSMGFPYRSMKQLY
jgi:hypothetical protein